MHCTGGHYKKHKKYLIAHQAVKMIGLLSFWF